VLLAERGGKSGDGAGPRPRAVFIVLGLAALPVALVLLQPDAGTVLVLGCIVVGMIVMSGASWRWLAGLVLAAVLAVLAVTQLGLLEQHQLDRFSAFANPDLDPRGVGYNTAQARIAVGSGGFLGDGLFQGQQTSGQFVPEQESDFIFTVAGEELGFIGSTAIIALLGVVLWRAIRIALHADDMFGTLLAAGIVCWFGFQAFQNIGMTIGIVPVTGLPLPFISYGGTAMFASLIAIGLLQNIQVRRT
jgi:rod shape determining protein RodA